MFTDREIDALRRFWQKKPTWLPAVATPDWSRVSARRNKVVGLWAARKLLRVLPTKGVLFVGGKRGSWLYKRSCFLARNYYDCQKHELSKLRMNHVRPINRPRKPV